MSAPSAVDITAWFGAAGTAIGALFAGVALRRKNKADAKRDEEDRDATDVASWSGLNQALNREVTRLHSEMDEQRRRFQAELDEQRSRFQAEMTSQREDYEERLRLANKRISDLNSELDALRRAINLRGEGGAPV